MTLATRQAVDRDRGESPVLPTAENERTLCEAVRPPTRVRGETHSGGDPSLYCYLVDPASSHMLVSKIKPCMSHYKPKHGDTANGSLNQLWFIRSIHSYLDNCSNSRANTCLEAPTLAGTSAFIRSRPMAELVPH